MLLTVARLVAQFALRATVGDWVEEMGAPAMLSQVMEKFPEKGIFNAHLGITQARKQGVSVSNAMVGNLDSSLFISNNQTP